MRFRGLTSLAGTHFTDVKSRVLDFIQNQQDLRIDGILYVKIAKHGEIIKSRV